MCYLGSNPEISRCLFYENWAEIDGGAIEIWENCDPPITNNTFSMNHAEHYGGAVDVYEASKPVLINNIFWGNTALTAGQQISITTDNCNISVTYCDVAGGEAGIGPYGIQNGTYENNIDEDPLFIDTPGYNFLLDSLAPSPCIDAGDPLSPPDPDGSPADMGCYYQYFVDGISHNQMNELMIYPNPATSKIMIVGNEFTNAEISLEVFNFLGQKVDRQRITSFGKMEIALDITRYPSGTYFCKMISGEKVYTSKFVKK